MIAAIYARKSTEQTSVADEQKSVTRQIDHARAYATSKGWVVDDAGIYIDDGISGAEFTNRPGFVRLMSALEPRAAFQVLIMSEVSRLGREQIETAYALKQLSVAGVRCFSYLEDRELRIESATDKFLLGAVTFAADLEREKARQRTYDAMLRKARAGHVTGGRVFGYDNVDVTAGGKRSHVVNHVNVEEAAIVRQIFKLAANGHGMKTIARTLNAAGLTAPRPQQRRPRGWAPSSVYEILRRDLYHGVRIWNKSKKRDSWGKKHQQGRPSTEWVTVPAEDLRIVSDDLWNTVHQRARARAVVAADYRQGRRPDLRDGRGVRRHYFLTGFGECAMCHGSIQAVSRASGAGRTFRYVCGTYWNRGTAICPNGRMVEMSVADAALRELLKHEVLRPAVVELALDRAIEMLQGDQRHDGTRRPALERAVRVVETELENLSETAAKGGAVPAVLEALLQREQERRRLGAELARLDDESTRGDQSNAWRGQMRALLGDWDALLAGDIAEARPILDRVLTGRITFRAVPSARGRERYELTVPIAFDRVLTAMVPELSCLQERVASPTGFEPVF